MTSLLRTIERNAGKVHKHKLANDLGISVRFLELLAIDNDIDLSLVPEREPKPAPSSGKRTVTVTTRMTPSKVVALDAVADQLHLPRAQVVSRVIENAIAAGTLLELARLPAARIPCLDLPEEKVS